MNRALVFCLGVTIGIMASYLVWHPVPSYATPRSAQLALVPVLLDDAALTGAPHGVAGDTALTTEVTTPLEVAAIGAPITGNAGWASPSLGSSYLAMRLPSGTLVTITGPGGSWTARVNDYGPSSKIVPSRIADIAVGHWTHVCGLPPSAGLCRVTVTSGTGGNGAPSSPVPTAPATDVDP